MRYVQNLFAKCRTTIRVRPRLDGHYVEPAIDIAVSRGGTQCWAVLTEAEAIELGDILTRALVAARNAHHGRPLRDRDPP